MRTACENIAVRETYCHISQSVHDLWRVELDLNDPLTPRFNMPFELGIVVGVHRKRGSAHTWSVFESNDRRLKKSLGDLAETDPFVHHGSPTGVLSELLNVFVRLQSNLSMPEMEMFYDLVMKALPGVLSKADSKTLFKARAFQELIATARDIAKRISSQ